MKLVSLPDGTILHANRKFCEWSNYTLYELTRLTWIQLSVNDTDLQADIEQAKKLQEFGSYSVQKRFIPKNSKPQLGNLHVTRYPETGPIEFCLCNWEPLVNGTAQAFELAMSSHAEITERLDSIGKDVHTLTSRTEEEIFGLAAIRMIGKHPKIAMTAALCFLTLIGFGNALSVAQKLGLIKSPPVVIEKDQR